MRTRVRVRSARGGAGPGAAPAASGSPPPWVRRDRSVWGGGGFLSFSRVSDPVVLIRPLLTPSEEGEGGILASDFRISE